MMPPFICQVGSSGSAAQTRRRRFQKAVLNQDQPNALIGGKQSPTRETQKHPFEKSAAMLQS
ncbi:hypothetical protein PG984_013694 [Apiospora sp. TS-2023a]